MTLTIVGNDDDVKRYREILRERGILSKSQKDHDVYATKPDEFRLMMGEITKCSYTPDFKSPVTSQKQMLDPESRLYIKGIANARIVDRMDEIIEPSGGDFKAFTASPILLADHMYWCQSAIGQVTSMMPEFDGLHFEAWIGDPAAGPLTDKQREVRTLVSQGIVKTVSIGFIPLEIKAPTWDNEGRLLTPAHILRWELLELSVVAVPCNAGSTFEMRQYTDLMLNKSAEAQEKILTEKLKQIENDMKAESTVVQTLIFDKKKFTVDEAKQWAKNHDFRYDKVDETTDSIRLRQRNPADFIEGSFRTIELTDGVKAVIGRLKDTSKMEEKINGLIESVKTLVTSIDGMGTKIEKHLELSATIVKEIEEKKKPCKPKDENGCPGGSDDEDEMKKALADIDFLKKEIGELKDVLKTLIERI